MCSSAAMDISDLNKQLGRKIIDDILDMTGTSHFRSQFRRENVLGLGPGPVQKQILVPVSVRKKNWSRSRFAHLYDKPNQYHLRKGSTTFSFYETPSKTIIEM